MYDTDLQRNMILYCQEHVNMHGMLLYVVVHGNGSKNKGNRTAIAIDGLTPKDEKVTTLGPKSALVED
jgi:hypothetical protein